MASLSRRSFLRGALTVSALAVAGSTSLLASAPGYPTLWGDGIHDDAPALNALLSGNPVRCEGEVIQHAPGETIVLSGGAYLVASTVSLELADVYIPEIHLTAANPFKGDCMFLVEPHCACRIGEISIQHHGGLGGLRVFGRNALS